MAELAKIRALCTGADPNDTLVAEAAAAVQCKQFQEALDKILQLPDDAPQKLDFQAQNIYCVCLWQVGSAEHEHAMRASPRLGRSCRGGGGEGMGWGRRLENAALVV